ncbi:cysteine-rich receptor-like protein kinase 25 isoform X2 [Sorghum bicolor]|uniref:Protein kinase domain-containing protein n=2 Tax=Sorghum bicolor TaxID=4558 RepID=A0A1B6PR95_SORBI|nr:cysteine-rich receptor-like protein kinase 25 isoform X2 [Sorghum bicolor]KXG28191.1 hypothetical protein SORBI_3005G095500 [Sorghum bicolor]|eukprot:XP_021316820.1 cysteine-rich receptor-like protein kinase 25 isoform X2 [Sorghum bicolor]
MASKSSFLNTLPTNSPAQFLNGITDGFSDAQKLGEGAFGTVYKGILQDGEPIAVKKLADNAPVAPEKQFKIGVGNLMAMQHPNIVRLLGSCREPQKKVIEHSGRYIMVDVVESLLYYEYIPNGNLDKYISDTSLRPDWKTCFEIIKGICQGLLYLHKKMDRPIVHLDLHPTNILLDENMVPKITDFGLSRLFGEEQTRINTINVVGKKGYMAPEYLYRGEISTRSDIYSLGVVIMEFTTGEKSCSSDKDMSAMDFVDKVCETWTDEHIASKHSALDAGSLQEVRTCIKIGLKCVDIDQNKRPSIVEIVDELNGRRAH